jgi:hypothetical protein
VNSNNRILVHPVVVVYEVKLKTNSVTNNFSLRKCLF